MERGLKWSTSRALTKAWSSASAKAKKAAFRGQTRMES